jgi:hypothetical protein
MVFPTKILVLSILYRFSRLLQYSLWWWMVRWPEHAWLLLARRRSVEHLVVIRRLLLLSNAVVQHRAAERWSI